MTSDKVAPQVFNLNPWFLIPEGRSDMTNPYEKGLEIDPDCWPFPTPREIQHHMGYNWEISFARNLKENEIEKSVALLNSLKPFSVESIEFSEDGKTIQFTVLTPRNIAKHELFAFEQHLFFSVEKKILPLDKIQKVAKEKWLYFKFGS